MRLATAKTRLTTRAIAVMMLLITLCQGSNAFAETNNAINSANNTQIMNLEGEVQGQRSQPKVLFILPWEEELSTSDIQFDESLISEEDFLAPVDRNVFQDQINLYKQLETAP